MAVESQPVMTAPEPPPIPPLTTGVGLRRFYGVAEYWRRASRLLWDTDRKLGLWLAGLSLLTAALPTAAAYVGKLIVDSVITAARSGSDADRWAAMTWVAVELVLVAALTGTQRGLSVCESLLRAQLGQRVTELVLRKALTLGLADFENPEVYDRMTRARQEAPYRPLSMVRGVLRMAQGALALLGCALLLSTFSYWMLLLLAGAALPAFLVEARYSTNAFRLFRWHSPETRRQKYFETVLGRDDHAKEVQLFGIGPVLLDWHRAIFQRLYAEDRALTLKRGFWGFWLGVLSSAALYASYAWIASEAIDSRISLGDMTMYLLLFKQAQTAITTALSAVVGLYNDNLYVSTLYEFLAYPAQRNDGRASTGPDAHDGFRFERVSFGYHGEDHPAVCDVTLHIPPGIKLALVGQNGAGKTTLVKLLTGLYRPTAGRILLDGRDLREWDEQALRRRIGVIFQDFVHYQLRAGPNIGVGDSASLEDERRWQEAAAKAAAAAVVERLPDGYQTQLGRWFPEGHELSTGEWQKLALARGFMRRDADILVLDEPTASMDAAAEAELFQSFRRLAEQRTAILISHRFSTVREADQIAVLQDGRLTEQGTHDQLVAQGGHYARLFALQAGGYR